MKQIKRNLLLWVISRIGKEPWKETPLDTISTTHDNAKGICVDEIIIQKEAPDCVDQFTLQKCEHLTIRRGAIYFFVNVLN